MKKTYENPMLQVVGISNNDIVTNSRPVDNESHDGVNGDAPGLRMFDFEDYSY